MLGLATALPAAAVISHEDTQVTAKAAPADTTRSDRTVERVAARTTSRSAERELTQELLAARWESAERSTEQELASRLKPQKRLVRWVSTDLNLWARPGERGRLLTVLDPRTRVVSTGEVRNAWVLVHQGKRQGWVRRTYLVKKKPPKPAAARVLAGTSGPARPSGTSGAPCPDGSSVESGLMPNTIKLYRSVCAAFPAVSSWGGRSGSGDHGAGLALDIMVSGSAGYAIAEYVRANAGSLGVSEVIWAQRIWTVQRGGEGWRPMSDRGSSTANHFDHVHVSVYG